MEVKVYIRKTDATSLLEALTADTNLVRVQSADYDMVPIIRDIDVESKIICGKDIILSDFDKVCGIIAAELWLRHFDINYGDILEHSGKKVLRTVNGYIPVEIKEDETESNSI